MFEDRDISIKAYNLNTILAEKIESILVRNVANTRARDYYDVYILLTVRKNEIDAESSDLKAVWESYTQKYPYAKGIEFAEITNILRGIFKTE